MYKAMFFGIIILFGVIISSIASCDNYPIFIQDQTNHDLYYWNGSVQPDEEDITTKEESMSIKTLVLPENLKWFSGYNAQFEALEEYIVDESSPFLRSIDGVLFTKDMRVLLAYPRGKTCSEYQIPNGVIRIAESAFEGNTHLQDITLSEDVKWICRSAFSSCSALKKINLNEKLSCIEDRAFEYCRSLKEFNCPENLKIIGYHAFYMSSLNKLTLNDGLVCVMGEAFFTHCFDEAEIFLPASILYFDRTVFSADEKITIISASYSDQSIYIMDGVINLIVSP